MSASAASVSDLISSHQLLPWLLSSAAVGILFSLKKFCSAIKAAILASFLGLAEVNRGLCDFVISCDANWCRAKSELAAHRRRDIGDLVSKRGARP
jgi:hypothetical protein